MLRILRTTSPRRPNDQNEPELVRLACKQVNECDLTVIPNDKDCGFVFIQVCDVCVLRKKIIEEGLSKSLWKWGEVCQQP